MNIVYSGVFLREGLLQAGHKLIEPKAGQDVPQCLHNLHEPVDLVLLELFGNHFPFGTLEHCGHKMAAWCIDSPLNEFWLKDACFIFDHVFVDQKSSVDMFKNHGVNASWLPLCAQNEYFVPASEKIHDITFVGSINNLRLKRSNLIKHISRYFNLNVISNATLQETQRIFAQSRMVLNENLFSGLTLRIFQALASGSLLLTEADACGVEDHFVDGQDLAAFTPDNVLEKLDYFLHVEDARQKVARQGHEKCRQAHTSTARAAQFFHALADGHAANERKSDEDRHWHRLCAQYFLTLRFGGSLAPIMKELDQLAQTRNSHSPQAHIYLGDIFSNANKSDLAAKHYRQAASLRDSHLPFLRLSILYLHANDLPKARSYMNLALKKTGYADLLDQNILNNMQDEASRLLYAAAKIHFFEGRLFNLGFQKGYEDRINDTAFDMAMRLWRREHSPWAMELMLDALAPSHMQGELLPTLMSVMDQGVLSSRQKLAAADIALKYYDMETADKIISTLKK